MDVDGYYHNLVQSARLRITPFSFIVWGLSVVLGFVLLLYLGLWALLIPVIGLAIGLPIPGYGPPHRWALIEWENRAQWRRDHGDMLVPALGEEPDSPPGKIERTEVVYATVRQRVNDEQAVGLLPVLTDDDREFLTVPIRLGGAAQYYLAEDPDGRYEWDLTWMESMSHALGVTREKDLQVAFTHIHRPSNIEPVLNYARRRAARGLFAASDEDSVEGRAATNLANRIDLIDGGAAGDARDYVFVRTPWPTRYGKKTSLEDADSFRRSSLYRTIQEVVGAYVENGVDAGFLAPSEVQPTWDYFWRVADSDKVHLYEERDRELDSLHVGEEAESEDQPELDKGISITASPPGTPCWINYNGTIFMGGYATAVRQPKASSGFRRRVVLSDDTFYAFTLYCEANLRSAEEKKARERERASKLLSGENLLERGLSNPREGERHNRIIERRQQLAQAGNRVSDDYKLFSLGASSIEEAQARWDDMVTQFASLYTIVPVTNRNDLEDLLLAQWGLRFKRD
jgi:hypothetical protein